MEIKKCPFCYSSNLEIKKDIVICERCNCTMIACSICGNYTYSPGTIICFSCWKAKDGLSRLVQFSKGRKIITNMLKGYKEFTK